MTPFNRHQLRLRLGMTAQAEMLLDMVANAPTSPSFHALKSEAHDHKVSSPATSHQALHWLIDHEYLAVKADANDARVKRLRVTAKGKRYLVEIEA